jgi:hypothetical protein
MSEQPKRPWERQPPASDAPKPWAAGASEPPPAAPPIDDATAARHALYGQRIAFWAKCGTVVGGALGVVLGAVLLIGGEPVGAIQALVMFPFALATGGFTLGMALTCLFAPREFLTGPVGKPWMDRIGTKSVTVARIACALFGLMVLVPVLGVAALVAFAR